ncbi:recombinase family protein [Tumebacillus lipolyticus]|uniref:Recombinase family protein n=1 Tax=Tumebacillus lipolyticus TaxID=1280370 RepID=A0ABW4ZU95_9BACL
MIKSVDRPREEWLEREGKHEPLIDQEVFAAAQEIMNDRSNREYQQNKKPQNPLSGLIRCRICNSKMQRRPYNKQAPHLICPTKGCIRSSQFAFVERKLIESLRDWYDQYKINYSKLEKQLKSQKQKKQKKQKNLPTKLLADLEEEIAVTQQQKDNLNTLVERGVYDV